MFADARSSFGSDREAIEAVAGILGIDDPKVLRKWVKSTQLSTVPPVDGTRPRRQWKSLVFRTHTIVIGSIITVVGGLGLAYFEQHFGIGQPGASPSEPHLEVDQVGLSYGSWTGKIPDPFRIDVKLLNPGRQLVAINGARLVIERSITLRQCAAGGEDFPSTGSYRANLPGHPKQGDVIDIPVSQLVPADGADRFELLLRTRLPMANLNRTGVPVYLYRIHLYLTYNAPSHLLDAGDIVVGYPFAPVSGQYYWTRFWEANPSYFDTMMNNNKDIESRVKECDISGSEDLRAFFASVSPGTKQPIDLAGTKSRLAY
jgi:hypothetical protein